MPCGAGYAVAPAATVQLVNAGPAISKCRSIYAMQRTNMLCKLLLLLLKLPV
jgi:hypothetical protein